MDNGFCAKKTNIHIPALAAAQHIIRQWEVSGQRLRVPTRAEYLRRIRLISSSEESSVVDPYKVRPAKPPRTYTDSECRALLEACHTQRDRLILLLLQRVGLRNAALRHLLLRDVTEDEPPHAPRRMGQALEKGGVVRQFVLDDDIQSCLIRYLTEEYGMRVRMQNRFTAYLFPRCHTQPDCAMSPSHTASFKGRGGVATKQAIKK